MEMFAFGEPIDIGTRHPSPWHQLSNSLSPSALPSHSPSPRRTSSNGSIALANWDQQLSERTGEFRRSQLVLSSGSINDDTSNTNTSDGDTPRTPKLEAERDKEGHIEYKLKLIDPCSERFERLVTQMKWRLSQGGNEAIYEIGLADDGSVIGLTRAEMDASLRTLELMASELGATVMILQEIVIVSPSQRTDLYADGLPKRGTKAIVGEDVMEHVVLPRIKTHKKPKAFTSSDLTKPRVRIDRDAKYQEKMLRRKAIAEAKAEEHSPFILEIGEGLEDTLPIEYGWATHKQRRATPPSPVLQGPGKVKRNDARRQRAQARRERRHADLLAGDGCTANPDDSWLGSNGPDDESTAQTTDALTSANLHALTHSRAGFHSLSLGQADPTRASSLRLLVSPVGSPPLDDLSAAPLDSVSLSFADVRTVTGDDAKSESDGDSVIRPLAGEEMICVEALVIRKGQQEEYVDFDWYQHESGSELRSSEKEEEEAL